MKILIEETDKNYLTEHGLREFISQIRRLLCDSGFKRQSVDFDLHNSTLIHFVPDIADMQEIEEDFEQKWLIKEAKADKEDLEEFIENE